MLLWLGGGSHSAVIILIIFHNYIWADGIQNAATSPILKPLSLTSNHPDSHTEMMTIKRLHYISGLTISVFIGLHLFNHFYSIPGAEEHIHLMNTLRLFYRNIFVETLLLSAVLLQIISGLRLFKAKRKTAAAAFDRLHIWTGLYLAVFLIIHVAAVFVGRLYLHLDTNFYFGAAGLNTFPLNLFFIPYYALAIISVFGHIASVHHNKMSLTIAGATPNGQAKAILIFGLCLTIAIFYGLTNHFRGLTIPKEYQVLVGK